MDLTNFKMEEIPDGVRFRIKVQAKARREEIGGVIGDTLRVRVNAPALEGRANKAVISLLAKGLQVSKCSIKITAGERSALKTVVVTELRPTEALTRLRSAAK